MYVRAWACERARGRDERKETTKGDGARGRSGGNAAGIEYRQGLVVVVATRGGTADGDKDEPP